MRSNRDIGGPPPPATYQIPHPIKHDSVRKQYDRYGIHTMVGSSINLVTMVE